MKYKGKTNIYKINVEKEKELAGIFRIQSIPTFLFIPVNGKPSLSPGFHPKAQLEKQIEEKLLK